MYIYIYDISFPSELFRWLKWVLLIILILMCDVFWRVLGENALGWYLSDLCCPLSEVGCIEVLPCVKSSRLAISVSWLSGGIPRKKTTWHSAILLPSRFQTPWKIPYTSLLLHDFYAKNPRVSYHSLGHSGSFYRFKSDMEAMALWLRYCIYHYIMNALMV